MSDWKQAMRDANSVAEVIPANDRQSRVDAIMDARRARIAADGPFQKLENKMEHEKHPPANVAAAAAAAGRKSLGQAEMTRRSVAGRKDSDDAGFKESEHPREGGKFAEKGGGSAKKPSAGKMPEGGWGMEPLPATKSEPAKPKETYKVDPRSKSGQMPEGGWGMAPASASPEKKAKAGKMPEGGWGMEPL